MKHTGSRCGCVPGLRAVPFLTFILVILLHVFVSWRLLLNRDLPVTLEIKHRADRIMRIPVPWALDSFAQHSGKECSMVLLKLLCKKWLLSSTAWAPFPLYNHKKFGIILMFFPPRGASGTHSPSPHVFVVVFWKGNMFVVPILFLFLL